MTETTNEKTTLVLGGTGKTGRRVVERLRARDLTVRIGSRTGEPPFVWEDERTWRSVLRNVGSVYVVYYPDLTAPSAAPAIRSFATVAVENGVRRLVLLSGRGEEATAPAEQAVRDSGAEWTILRASWLSQNFSEDFLLEPVINGEIVLPAGDVAEPFVDSEDVAAVAVAALIGERHANQIYELTGPRLLTFAEAAGEIAKAANRDVRYVPIPAESFAAVLAEHNIPAEHITLLTDLFVRVLDGRNAHLTGDVQRVLGRKPRDFSDYARDAAATGVWS